MVLAVSGCATSPSPTAYPTVSAAPIPSETTALTPEPTAKGAAWTVTGGMMEALRDYSATLLADGRVLAAGGSSPAGGNTASAELYDPSSGTWATTGPATLLLDGRVLVAGGGVDGRAAEVYDPSTGSWAATGDMVITVTASPRATLLLDGRVLVTGVTSVGEPFASAAQLYDPANGSWSLTGTPIEPRFAYSATRLNDGKVLVAGAAVGGVGQLTSAELYDPISGSWTATGRLVNPHADGHTATLLPDGKVLVAGG